MSGKFDQLRSLIEKDIEVVVLTETKIDKSFLNSRFIMNGYLPLFRYGRNRFEGALIYIRDDIPC